MWSPFNGAIVVCIVAILATVGGECVRTVAFNIAIAAAATAVAVGCCIVASVTAAVSAAVADVAACVTVGI